MPQSAVDHRLEIPQGVRDKLATFRRRVWTVKILEGLGAAVCGLLLSYLVVFGLDRFYDTPAWLRALLLALGSVGLGIAFPLKCHRWVWQSRKFDQLARLLKIRMPRLADRMLGIIELAQSDREQQRSAALCQAAFRQVDEDIREISFEEAVPRPHHRMWGWAALIPTAVAVFLLVLVPAAGSNALRRWLMPWRHTSRYTFAQLANLPSEIVVPVSEAFSLTAALSDTSAWRPDRAVARIGKQLPVTARRDGKQYAFTMPAQHQDGTLLLSAGDVRASVQVAPKPRPELTELVAQVKLPDYLQYRDPQTRDARGGTLSVLKGSAATLSAVTSRTLHTATLNGEAQAVDRDTVVTRETLIDDEMTLALSWTDAYGLSAKAPFELTVQVTDDLAPTIVCSELTRQQVVLVDQVLTFEVSADDDFGLKHLGLEWHGVADPLRNPTPASGEMLIMAGGPESTELKGPATFCAAREGIAPQTIELRLFTTDYLPERGRVYSPPYTLFILSSEEHANWLTEQLRRWSRQAQEVYERENQLYETNRELRALAPAELTTTKNRQRLETQAAAESANARQLAAVSAVGKQLIMEATRNDQFDATTLENLADMVNTLDAMAAQRMPSVADLLKQAASAPAVREGPPSAADDPSSDEQNAAPQVGNNRDPNRGTEGGSDQQSQESKDKPVPRISDIESSMNRDEENGAEEDEEQTSKPSSGSSQFGLPSTTVLGGGQQQQTKKQATANETLDEAVREQEDLLDAFAAVADELQRILDSLEGSTFVKRLKAASRRHLRLADDLNASLDATFGRRISQLSEEQQGAAAQLAETEVLESQNLLTIRQDLEAYYNRVQQGKFRAVLTEMNELNVVTKLEQLGELVGENLHGQAIAHAEYWADTLDRWAEELVGPGQSSESAAQGSQGDSLSPAIVLDVMKILEKEMGLREETRSTEQALPVLSRDDYTERARGLAETQHAIGEMTSDTIDAILKLELEKGASFPNELQLLNHVGVVMTEVEALLNEPNTGGETIAAETEIIEMLLQVQRQQPPKKSSQGSSGSKPNGGGEGETEESALALLGRGDETNAGSPEREIRQATGTAGSTFPAEFRAGLDAYFAELEK